MISIQHGGTVEEYYGKSSDTKPVDGTVKNGSTFFEIDTGNVFIFDEEAKQWIAL